MALIEDPNAEARSLMMQAPCVCDGELNGVRCKFYWALMQKFPSANADVVREGKKRRNCTMVNSFMLEWSEDEKPTYCQMYEPAPAPGFVNGLVRIARKVTGTAPLSGAQSPKTSALGYKPFDRRFEDFRPMTPEEIEANRKANPDRPVQFGTARFSGLKNPLDFTAGDIKDGDQIAIIPQGEAMRIREEAARMANEAIAKGVSVDTAVTEALLKAMSPPVSAELAAALDDDEPKEPEKK